jgi:hypothetical protein
MKRVFMVALFAVACAADDHESEGETAVPEGGPCGLAGGPLPDDELQTPSIGSDADGRPTVIVELHEAGTCNGEPPAAVASVSFDLDTTSIVVANEAVEIVMPADYRNQQYWWDDLGVDAELVQTTQIVTITFYLDKLMRSTQCTADAMAVSCS